MSVLEICRLQIKPDISTNDRSVLKSLIEVRSSLKAKVTNTYSQFYQCIEDPSLIYILGMWPTISAHHNFLSSPQRPEILLPQEDLLDFNWVMHMPLTAMESLPLDAHVMSIAKFSFKDGKNIAEFQRLMDTTRQSFVEGIKPYKMVDGWRCDSELGIHEALVFTGWKNREVYEDFTTEGFSNLKYTSTRDLWNEKEVRHMMNMEA